MERSAPRSTNNCATGNPQSLNCVAAWKMGVWPPTPFPSTVALASTGTLPDASARAFLDPEGRRLLLVVYDLPPPPPGQSYQLWVILGGEPVSAGVFDVGPGGRARHEAASLPPIEGPVTIAVTVEPAGGLPKPSGPMVLAGS